MQDSDNEKHQATRECFGIKLKARHALGLLVLSAVIVIWVASSNLMQYIFLDADFNKPFFLTYFSTSLFSVYLLGFLFRPSWRKYCFNCMPKKPSNTESASDVGEQIDIHYTINTNLLETPNDSQTEQKLPPLEVIKLSAMFCPFWFAANYCFNASLTMTSVSSNTILSTTSGLFTLILGSLVGVDKFTFAKLFAVLLSFGGVCLVSIADETNAGKHTILGDVLSLLSAVLYAIYIILLKKMIKDEKMLHMSMFFGFLGSINSIVLLPIMYILNVTGVETFEVPSHRVMLFLFANGMIGTVLSDYLWLLSVLLTSPLISTLGLSLTTVLAMIVDFFIKHKTFGSLYMFGAVAILLGFLLVNTDEYTNFDKTIGSILCSSCKKNKTDM